MIIPTITNASRPYFSQIVCWIVVVVAGISAAAATFALITVYVVGKAFDPGSSINLLTGLSWFLIFIGAFIGAFIQSLVFEVVFSIFTCKTAVLANIGAIAVLYVTVYSFFPGVLNGLIGGIIFLAWFQWGFVATCGYHQYIQINAALLMFISVGLVWEFIGGSLALGFTFGYFGAIAPWFGVKVSKNLCSRQ